MSLRELVLNTLTASAWLPALLVALPVSLATAIAGAGDPPAPLAPSAAALELIRLMPEAGRRRLLQPFTDEARSDWHYTPRQRSGVPWKDMSEAERKACTALLRTALSAPGLDKVRAIMGLEIALRELETFGTSRRDPGNYALAIFGAPSAQPGAWGFRLEGHHLSLHFTLDGDHFVSSLPQFMGANPARVPRDMQGGPRQGTRVLADEEDLARALLGSLAAPERAAACFDTRTYGDIVTRNARALDPLAPVGVAFGALRPEQQALLLRLIGAFASHLEPELADARLARVRAGGLDSLRFGWAGATEPGKPFYYRIQGKTFLIELDNSGGNHIHSVWRDLDADWGRDWLREHYTHAGKTHGHGTPR